MTKTLSIFASMIKKILATITALTLLTTISATAQCPYCKRDTVRQEQSKYSPSTLIIWYDASSKRNKKRLMKAVKAYKASIIYDYKNFNGIAIKIPEGPSLEAAITYFQKVKGVLQVNRDGIMTIQ